MDEERDLQGGPEHRFTPDTLPSAGPAYGANQPYDPASPVSQTEQQPLEGEIPEATVIRGIRERLAQHPELGADAIDAAFDHGVVILTGTVRDEALRKLAEEAALATPGVIAVDNDLKLAGPEGGA